MATAAPTAIATTGRQPSEIILSVAFLGLLLFMVFAAMWITAKHRKTPNE